MAVVLGKSALAPQDKFVARRILASTERLVEQVQAEEWSLVPDTLRERRGLLRELRQPRTDSRALSCIEALHAAVSESELVLLQIVPVRAAATDFQP